MVYNWFSACFTVFHGSLRIPFQNFTNLTEYGVSSMGRNFYLQGENGLRLGCWHILPYEVAVNYQGSVLNAKEMELLMETLNYPIIVYFHGNSFDRSHPTRCGLYNLLTGMGFHVLALDYRGYGDSNGSPSESGLIEDAKEIFRYAKSHSGSSNIYLWGHSMGTAVATAAAMELSENGSTPAGLILESPFNNLHDVVTHHPYALPFRWLPWFEKMVLKPLDRCGLDMSTDYRITKVDCPVLILHAEDDHIIPLHLAHKLHKSALDAKRDVTLEEFEASRRFHHKFIYLADELPKILTRFTERCNLNMKKVA
uniref:Serine aminopeptidase S33 domain-containing protein n=1 Tax=Setaria digitata TaxID=48799 RepID=A0A915PNI9_9BILA